MMTNKSNNISSRRQEGLEGHKGVVSNFRAVAFAAVLALAAALPVGAEQQITRSTFRDVAKKASPGVVNIKVKSNIQFGGKAGRKASIPPGFGLDDEMRDYLERLFEQQMPNLTPNDEDAFRYSRSASGVIVRPDGYVVTSNHVVSGVNADDIEVALPDGRSFDKVQLIGTDDLTDLAVLKVDGKDLPAVTWGDSDKLEVGDFVVAIGNPLEFNNSVSEGIVSAKHRVIKKAPIEDLIQTTAAINPGNSGGALVNLDGELIGINMAIATSTGLWSGLSFAIPSKTAREVTDQVIERGRVARGYLGIEMERLTNSLAKQLNYDKNYGIIVKNVRPDSAAEKAGIQRYDVIAKVNGKEIKDIYDMHRNVGVQAAGSEVELLVYRDEGSKEPAEKKVIVKLDERPPQEQIEKRSPDGPMPGKKPSSGDLLGLSVSPAKGGKGVVVDEVEPGSRAAIMDIQKGDLILQVNKQDVGSREDVQKALKSHTTDSHLLYIERKDGASRLVEITAK
ncbi:MAG: trypsin-like peptidase domain-containing protein [Candidatus Sumerlaeaceae bacterium]|nr:trypsin-like peptidase domain-containing protein [Candidatus Sumerlaeaceae bacterium]